MKFSRVEVIFLVTLAILVFFSGKIPMLENISYVAAIAFGAISLYRRNDWYRPNFKGFSVEASAILVCLIYAYVVLRKGGLLAHPYTEVFVGILLLLFISLIILRFMRKSAQEKEKSIEYNGLLWKLYFHLMLIPLSQ